MSEKDNEEPEWLERYRFLSKKITLHKENVDSLDSEIQELKKKLGYKRFI